MCQLLPAGKFSHDTTTLDLHQSEGKKVLMDGRYINVLYMFLYVNYVYPYSLIQVRIDELLLLFHKTESDFKETMWSFICIP